MSYGDLSSDVCFSDVGGDIANNLFLLYDYMSRQLIEANKNNDIELLNEITALLLDIKSAWVSIPDDIRHMDRETLKQSLPI